MRSSFHRLVAVLTGTVAAIVLAAGTAGAAPVNAPSAQTVSLDCGSAGTYQIVTNGNGQFTPGHDLNSNRVLIPVAFGEQTFTETDANGNVVFTDTQPAVSKGRAGSHGHRTLASCTFSLTFPTPDGNTATVTGSVTGFVSGRPA
jgi:hypothetical protein